jgi:hypothetical protein
LAHHSAQIGIERAVFELLIDGGNNVTTRRALNDSLVSLIIMDEEKLQKLFEELQV